MPAATAYASEPRTLYVTGTEYARLRGEVDDLEERVHRLEKRRGKGGGGFGGALGDLLPIILVLRLLDDDNNQWSSGSGGLGGILPFLLLSSFLGGDDDDDDGSDLHVELNLNLGQILPLVFLLRSGIFRSAASATSS